jgi:aminomethyltransferase
MKRTPLYDEHLALKAKMVSFAGWEMPVQYKGIIEEHTAVRRDAGMFDVSHMGDIIIKGPGAVDLADRLITNNVKGLAVGKAVYGHILNEEGHILDDTIIYHWREGEYLMVPNAATTDRILQWVRAHATTQQVVDVSSRLACIALQGPKAVEILDQIAVYDVRSMKRISGDFMELMAEGRKVEGATDDFQTAGFLCDVHEESCRPGTKGTRATFLEQCYVSRTGYTGEDGFEILLEAASAPALWRVLLRLGREMGLEPAGLGARDTLRLEMGFLLSGTDFDGAQSSVQTGPPWVIKLDHDFIGREALIRQKEADDYERLVCLELIDKGIPRHGYQIAVGGEQVGRVTSGTLSPCLRKGIAMGYVRAPYHQLGTEVDVVIRGALAKARVVKPPFFRRSR